jgi:hypothetical protein
LTIELSELEEIKGAIEKNVCEGGIGAETRAGIIGILKNDVIESLFWLWLEKDIREGGD